MRVFARRERPHPGAQLSLFETADGWRYSLWATNLPLRRGAGAASAPTPTPPTRPRPGRGRHPHRQGHRPRPLPLARLQGQPGLARRRHVACILLAWLKLIALDGELAKAEPKTLRYRLLHAAARLARGGRRRTLKIAADWPWTEKIVTAWQRIQAIPHPGDQPKTVPPRKKGTPGPVEPRPPGPTAGLPSCPGPKIRDRPPDRITARGSHQPP